MRVSLFIRKEAAPALGDVRELGVFGTVWLHADATERADWARYADAIASAVTRGADVRWIRRAS